MKIKAADPLKSSDGALSGLSSFPSRLQTKGCIPRKLATFQMSIFSRSRAIVRIACSGRSVRKLREIRSKETREAWVGLQIVARPKPPPFFLSSIAIAPSTVWFRLTNWTPLTDLSKEHTSREHFCNTKAFLLHNSTSNKSNF